nr:site-specific integrase [candidate division KSB1 bacterium]
KYNRVNIFRIIRKAGEKAGFSIHPHTLRHSCAMHLKFMGKSPQYIQKYLGHSKVNITIEHYFHDKPEDEVMDIF